MIFTVHDKKISKEIVDLQKKVCEKFNVDINQILIEDWVSHGHSVDEVLRNFDNPEDVIVLFDIDSIPLNENVVPNSIDWCKNNIGIISVAQRAINIKDSEVHGGPAFMVFSIKTYNELGRPSFETTSRSDCGGELTHISKEKNIRMKLMLPTHVERNDFTLCGDLMFGMGTTYDNDIYHAFESRFNKNDHYFVNKCHSLL